MHTVGRVVRSTYQDQFVAWKQEIAGIVVVSTACAQPPREQMMEIGETLYVTNRDEFRKWLIPNHMVKKEIWLIQYKKATKKPSINYVEAVEEAICFGWIDGLEKSMDAERYALRFSPRRPKSNWTETNKERARKMIAQGRMTEAGIATLPPDMK